MGYRRESTGVNRFFFGGSVPFDSRQVRGIDSAQSAVARMNRRCVCNSHCVLVLLRRLGIHNMR